MWFVRAEGLNKLGKPVKLSYTARFRNFDTRNGFSEGGRGEERGRKKAGLRYSRTPVTRTLKGNSSSYRGGLQNSFSVLKIDTC